MHREDDLPAPPLAWSHAVTDIPGSGLAITRKASAAELAEVRQALDILGCDQLSASYRITAITAITGGGYRLAGKLKAHVVQACIVTLEPVPADLDETFDVEYWPPGLHDEATTDEIEALSAAEIEPLQHGLIDAGRIVYETVAAALDPYPRNQGAEFEPPPEAPGSADAKANPFAVLAKLKPKV